MAKIGEAIASTELIIVGLCWLMPVLVSQHIPVSNVEAAMTWIEQTLGGLCIVVGLVRVLTEE